MNTEICDALTIMDEDKFQEKILCSDVLLIDTIKSTHYCTVYHKNGEGRLRANISALKYQLPHYLYCCRSSTIVNLYTIEKIDFKQNLLYLEQDLMCSFSETAKEPLRSLLQIPKHRFPDLTLL